MEFQLSEETLRELLTLKEWKAQMSTAHNVLTTELSETKAAMAQVGTALNALIAQYDAVATKLLEAVTPAQMEAAKVEFDEVQQTAKDIADLAMSKVPPPPPPVEEPPTEPPAEPPTEPPAA